MFKCTSLFGILLLSGCVTVSVPPECRVRRPFMDIGVPLSVQMEVERVEVRAENERMAKRGVQPR